MTGRWREERIAAHVDRALDPEDDAEIRHLLERDPEARAFADRLRALDCALRTAYPLPDGEMPAGIAAALRARPHRLAALPARRRRAWLPMAAAASIALLVGIGAAAVLSGLHGSRDAPALLADAGAPLGRAMEALPSGRLSDAGIRPLSTFRDAAGRPCREFETSSAAPARGGIACRVSGGIWEVVALAVLPAAPTDAPDGFAPASGAQERALDAALEAIGAGPTLDPAEEAALLRSDWQ